MNVYVAMCQISKCWLIARLHCKCSAGRSMVVPKDLVWFGSSAMSVELAVRRLVNLRWMRALKRKHSLGVDGRSARWDNDGPKFV